MPHRLRYAGLAIVGLAGAVAATMGLNQPSPQIAPDQFAQPSELAPTTTDGARAEAIFAGGCFWCVEADFDKIPGVVETISGFAGGHVANPSYHDVVEGGTGHLEVVKVIYDPNLVTYGTLVEKFWRTVDPIDAGGQFCDRGESYSTAIFYSSEEERALAQASRSALDASGVLPAKVATKVLEFSAFWPAETYHQDYYMKNPVRYRFYRAGCGRDQRLAFLWGAPERAVASAEEATTVRP